MPIAMINPWRLMRGTLRALSMALGLWLAAWLGLRHGEERALNAAARREQRLSDGHEQQLAAERDRALAAEDAAAVMHRRLLAAVNCTPADVATGLPTTPSTAARRTPRQ